MPKYKLILTVQDSYGMTKEIEAGTVDAADYELTDKDIATLDKTFATDNDILDVTTKATDAAKEAAISSTFIPQINEQKVLSWSNKNGIPGPEPVDLNPFDEWEEDSTLSDFIWEEE